MQKTRLDKSNGAPREPSEVISRYLEAIYYMWSEGEPLRVDGPVQDTLDSLFEIQERLFRWRYPDWDDTEPDELEFPD